MKLLCIVTLGLAVAAGEMSANAGVSLPILERTSGASSLAPLLKQITPGVVSIRIATKGRANSATNSSLSKNQRAATRTDLLADSQMRTTGSGVVIDPNEGIILTNTHVIDGADEITVAFADGRELQAKRVGSDAGTDVAVIRVQAQALAPIPVGNSDQLEVGDFVLAIGNPFQIGQTVTSGIISGLHRNKLGFRQHEDFIQTDAAIYPGNSGGALVNLRGELVGINTAFLNAGNTHPGMGFAIPINIVRTIADQIMKHGGVRRLPGVTFNEPIPALTGKGVPPAPPGRSGSLTVPGVAALCPGASIDETPTREPPKRTKGIPSRDEYESLSQTKWE
jgi:serine protease DegQ